MFKKVNKWPRANVRNRFRISLQAKKLWLLSVRPSVSALSIWQPVLTQLSCNFIWLPLSISLK